MRCSAISSGERCFNGREVEDAKGVVNDGLVDIRGVDRVAWPPIA